MFTRQIKRYFRKEYKRQREILEYPALSDKALILLFFHLYISGNGTSELTGKHFQ